MYYRVGVEGIIKGFFLRTCVRRLPISVIRSTRQLCHPPQKKYRTYFFLPRKAVIIAVEDELLLHLFVGTP